MTDHSVFDSDVLESTNLKLLASASRDDQRAWELLWGVYLPVVYSKVRRRKGFSPPDAENICQDVFRSVANGLAEFKREREGSFRKWLDVITENKCTDYLRKRNVAPAKGGSGTHDILNSLPDYIDDNCDDDEGTALSDKALVMRHVMEIVKSKLKTEKWQIYWDVVVEGRDRQDTADKYKVTIQTVYNTISRTNKKIKEIFEDLIDDDIYPAEQI